MRDSKLPNRLPTLRSPPFPTFFMEEEGDIAEDLYDEDMFIHTEASLSLT